MAGCSRFCNRLAEFGISVFRVRAGWQSDADRSNPFETIPGLAKSSTWTGDSDGASRCEPGRIKFILLRDVDRA
jgi:hypothetical protein